MSEKNIQINFFQIKSHKAQVGNWSFPLNETVTRLKQNSIVYSKKYLKFRQTLRKFFFFFELFLAKNDFKFQN